MSRILRRCALVMGAALAGPLAAQTPGTPGVPTTGATPTDIAAVTQAAATITADELARDLAVLAADSMRGPTPSPALERTARYLAARLRALGNGAADSAVLGTSRAIQHYPVAGQATVDLARSELRFFFRPHHKAKLLLNEAGRNIRQRWVSVPVAVAAWVHGTAAKNYRIRSIEDPYPSTLLVAGPQTPASLSQTLASLPPQTDLRQTTILYVPPLGADTATYHAVARALVAQSAGVVVVSAVDSATFATGQHAARGRPLRLLDEHLPTTGDAWVEVGPAALRQVFEVNGLDLAALRTVTSSVLQPLPFMKAPIFWRAAPAADTVLAPNVVAALAGRDSALRWQQFVIAARADDVVGMAGLVALARAFGQPGVQPRRPLVFLAASGGDAAWGIHYFLPRSSASLAVTLDLRGPLDEAAVAVDGTRDVELGQAPGWIAARHPELGLTVVDTGSVLSEATPARAFATGWVPTLAWRAGGADTLAADTRTPAAPGAGEMAASAARHLQLLFYTIHALADDARHPRLSAAARRRIAQIVP